MTAELIQYWHPTRGGWHVGEVVERKPNTVVVRPLGKRNETVIPAEDVREMEAK